MLYISHMPMGTSPLQYRVSSHTIYCQIHNIIMVDGSIRPAVSSCGDDNINVYTFYTLGIVMQCDGILSKYIVL